MTTFTQSVPSQPKRKIWNHIELQGRERIARGVNDWIGERKVKNEREWGYGQGFTVSEKPLNFGSESGEEVHGQLRSDQAKMVQQGFVS